MTCRSKDWVSLEQLEQLVMRSVMCWLEHAIFYAHKLNVSRAVSVVGTDEAGKQWTAKLVMQSCVRQPLQNCIRTVCAHKTCWCRAGGAAWVVEAVHRSYLWCGPTCLGDFHSVVLGNSFLPSLTCFGSLAVTLFMALSDSTTFLSQWTLDFY